MGPGGTFAHRPQPVQVGGSRLSALPSPHEVGHRELGRASPGSDSLRGSLCPAPHQISLQSASARFGAGPHPPPALPAALGCLRARRSAALGSLRPLGSALGSGPRPLRRRAFLRSSARGRALPARAHAGHQVRGGRRRVSARRGGRSAGLARRGWLRGSSRAGRAAPGRGQGGGGGARTGQGSRLGVQARRPGCAPDRPVGVRGPGRGGRTWWGGVPAIRRAQASSPGPPDAASCPRPRPASGWVGPGLSPGLNPQRVPPSRYLPGALRRLAAARTHHSVPKAHLPWSPSCPSFTADLQGRHPCPHPGTVGGGRPC